jgi:hypothetical protein
MQRFLAMFTFSGSLGRMMRWGICCLFCLGNSWGAIPIIESHEHLPSPMRLAEILPAKVNTARFLTEPVA